MPQHQHRRLVKYLVVIASVLTVFAIFSVWVQRQLLSTNEWVHTSGKLLENKPIQDALGTYAVSEFYGAVNVSRELQKALPKQFKELSGPAASGLQQLATDAVPQILATSRFQALWQDANRIAHEKLVAIVEGNSDVVKNTNGEVILNVRPLVVDLANTLGISAGLADKIPRDVGHLRILRSSDLGLAQDIAAGIRGLAIISSVVVLLLFVLAVYLSRGYRWVTLLAIGGGLAAAGVAALILREVVGTVVVNQLAASSAKDAGNAAWSIGTSLLVSIATTVIVYGGVFMVAGWLGSPSRSSRATRRFLTPILRDQVPALIGVFVAVALIFVLLGLGDTRAVLTRLFLIGFAAFGLVYLRRNSITEFPQAEMPDVSDSLRDGMQSVRGWFGRRAPRPSEPEDLRLERLERLAGLHERGALSDDEFEAEKAALLGGADGAD